MTHSIVPTHRRLLVVGMFAVVMAYVESAVVVYLRAMYGIEDLLRDMPLLPDQYTTIEIGREAATLLLLAIVGWIAGRGWQDRLGYAVFVFGAWDIFYYAWLAIFIGWPSSLLDWDILFLIPLPWWGPVLAPVLIALLLVVWGGLAVIKAARNEPLRFTAVEWSAFGAGVLVALYVFMADALRALPAGITAVSQARPTQFNWALFLVALVGMAFPLMRAVRSTGRSIRKR